MRLDHLVFAVPELESSVAAFEGRLGAAPAFGGRHESVGTHNAILPLRGGTYLELMAPDPSNPSPPLPLPFGLATLSSPRLVTWAAATRDIDDAVVRARSAGYDPGAIVDLSRKTPEGEMLRWRLTLRQQPVGDGLVPFLIDWGTTPHPSATSEPVCSLEGFRGEHADPDSVREMLRALDVSLDVEPSPHPRLRATIVGPEGSIVLG